MTKKNMQNRKFSFNAIFAFSLSVILCSIIVSVAIINRTSVERLTMEQLIADKTLKASNVISRLLYKSEILSALIKQEGDTLDNFDKIAATLVDDPSILNILIAPNGVVSNVYPLEGNESVIGLDFFSEGAGNKEAILAKETGELVLGGPFDGVQGYQILVGRLPVYTESPEGTKSFWGIVSVTLKYPQALDDAELSQLHTQGFAYEIWRVNPDDGQRQIITGSGYRYNNKTRYIEKPFSIINANWYFRILPVRAWYEFPETWALAFVGVLVSLLVALIVQNNYKLNVLNDNMQIIAHTDSLTGIPNRRCFFETVEKHVEMAKRENKESFVIIFDLDHFKTINDKYGHNVGDEVLKESALRTLHTIRPYDLFARYGGEEFIAFITSVDKETVHSIVERIRRNLCESPVNVNGTYIYVAASFGIAQVTPINDFETAAILADNALYQAKEEGRNRIVISE